MRPSVFSFLPILILRLALGVSFGDKTCLIRVLLLCNVIFLILSCISVQATLSTDDGGDVLSAVEYIYECPIEPLFA